VNSQFVCGGRPLLVVCGIVVQCYCILPLNVLTDSPGTVQVPCRSQFTLSTLAKQLVGLAGGRALTVNGD